MYHALENDDIIYNILQHVKSSTDLVNVAMTCSTLSDPALNMLWCEQSSLGRLIMCLPQDTWEVAPDGTIVFSREPSLTEWERVKINASRIRRLVFNSNQSPGNAPPIPSGPVLKQLFALFPPALLFPNLIALHFNAVSLEFRSDFALLRQFFLPGLETLAFDVPVDVPTSEVEQFVGALSTEAPGLRQLSITVDPNISACHFELPKLPKLNQLSILGSDLGLMWQNIPNILHSHFLQSLSLSVHENFEVENASARTPLDFTALKHLSLSGNCLQDCTTFLLQVVTPQLSAIEIAYRTAAIPAEITAVIDSLTASCGTFESLEKISIVDNSPREPEWPETTTQLHSRVFRPLFKFRKLSTVIFSDIGKYSLDDYFIEDVAVAWPGLRELRFASERPEPCNITQSGMLSLVFKCRSLRTLQLTFDATRFMLLPYKPGPGKPCNQTSLHELHLGHSTVTPAYRFFMAIVLLFPNLCHVTRYDSMLELNDREDWSRAQRRWKTLVHHPLILRHRKPKEALRNTLWLHGLWMC